MQQFIGFCVVGTLGFLVDVALVTGLVHFLEFDPYAARIFSIGGAMTFTWLLNRTFTFSSSEKASLSEWWRYSAINVVGAVINYGVYCAVLIVVSVSPLILATAIGSIVGLIWNYNGSRLLYTR